MKGREATLANLTPEADGRIFIKSALTVPLAVTYVI